MMTSYRRVGLGAPIGDFAMLWTPKVQVLSDGAEAFTHEGPIGTAPSHDLAHLLVAAASTLSWRPAGETRGIFRAEYNAVMTEHLLDKLYRTHVTREMPPSQIAAGLRAHGVWFTTQHFVPYPDRTEFALQTWARGVHTGTLTALSPYFFDMKHAERQDPGYMQRTWTARFHALDWPTGWSELTPHVAETIRTLAQ